MTPKREGWFASGNPRANIVAGAAAFVAASPDGCAVARFAWADLDAHAVSNERPSAAAPLGFVFPVAGDWRTAYLSEGRRWIRPGLPVTLMARGEFWCRFPYGSIAGQLVYAAILDGTPLSGQADDSQATPFHVLTSCAPGQLAIISSWSKFPS